MNIHIVTQRFVKCHHALRVRKVVKSSRQFAAELDYLPQSLSEILKGRRNVTVELLQRGVEKYGMNPHFLFIGEGDMFLENPPESEKIPTPQYPTHFEPLEETQPASNISEEIKELKILVENQTKLIAQWLEN